jgi:hypothetical protein
VIVYGYLVTVGVIVTSEAGIWNVAPLNELAPLTVTDCPLSFLVTVHPLNIYPVFNVALIVTVSSNLYVHSTPVG